jgi:uncharacterized membrane protein (UPF0127 family)
MRRWFIVFLAVLPLFAGGGTVAFKRHTFMAEVAASEQEREKGLMYRQSLAKDRCMFFVYSEDGYHAIWMKNCLIALDVAWVDADGKIQELVEHAPPCSPMRGDDCPTYGGTVATRYFIEFPAGTFRRLGIRKGDRLGWDLTLDNGSRVKGGAPVPEGRKR